MYRIASTLLALFVAVAASAASQLTSLDTTVGFTYGETLVRLQGNDLVRQSADCTRLCSGTPCPVKVLFGDEEAEVRQAHPDHITVSVSAQPNGRVVDVIVRVAGWPDLVLPNAFRFSDTAQSSPSNYAMHLLPLARDLDGANGSRWVTEWTMHNPTEIMLPVIGTTCPPNVSPCITPDIIAPQQTKTMYPIARTTPGEGLFFYLPRSVAGAIGTELRVRDVSRSAEGWGTEFPVVTAGEFKTSITLLDVPTDPRFRSTLRIYAPFESPMDAVVRVYPHSGSTPIEERAVTLTGIAIAAPVEFPLQPAYAQLDPITEAVRASGQARVRIRVDAVMPPLNNPPYTPPLWAFVSLTNNVTQQVTAITPHK